MRVLITGRDGQLAQSLRRLADDQGVELLAIGRPDLDLGDARSIEALADYGPDLVINAAAYTAVDQAEDEPEQAMRVNAEGAGLVAAMASRVGAPIIQISTDYVFDGMAERPYAEDAPTNPVGAYGRSKLKGEARVRGAATEHLIVRTSWVYSATGRNFVRTMLDLAKDRDVVRVVADQQGTPTAADDLAAGLLVAARQVFRTRAGWGTYHLAGKGTTSWATLARHVFECAEREGLPKATVEDVTTADYPTRARRPANSALNSERFADAFGYVMPEWRSSVARVVHHMAKGSV